MAAVGARKSDVVSELLKRGADVNAQNSDGMTALQYATLYDVQSGTDIDGALIKALVNAGADPRIVNKTGPVLVRPGYRLKVLLILREQSKNDPEFIRQIQPREVQTAIQLKISSSELQSLVDLLDTRCRELDAVEGKSKGSLP